MLVIIDSLNLQICTEFGLGEKELCRTKISLQGLVVFLTINFDLVNVEGPSG